MRPGVDAQPGRSAEGLAPGTDPVCLLITTVAVLVSLVVASLTTWPSRPAATRTAHPGPGTLPARLIPPARDRTAPAALQLLTRAAAASGTVAYHGMEMLAWRGPHAETAALADIWHRPGQEPSLRPAAPGLAWPSGIGEPGLAPPVSRTLAAVPGLSPRLVRLLAANYAIALGGTGTVAGRPAQVVTVRRASGRVAARFWLGKATKLPLRRDTYTAGGRLLSEETFISLTLGAGRGGRQKAQAWQDELTAGQLAALRSRAWPLPGKLPGKLTLVDARESHGASGPVVHLAYSDGLSVVSVFVEHGTLPPRPAGWSRTAEAGYPVYTDDPDETSITWSAHGFVFTVMGEAPPRTISGVVGALPHRPAAPPGLLERMRIGAHRLLSWLG